MTNQQPDYSNPPEWATPEAWARVEKLGADALAVYNRLRDDFEKNHFGKYVLIDASSTTARYTIADTEANLDQLFANDPSWKDGILFHVGHI